MKFSTKLIFRALNAAKFNHTPTLRNYATIVERELEVPTFCDIHIDLPYNVRVKPLNVHKYHNCDKLIIQIDESCENSLDHDVNGNRIEITDKSEWERSEIFCNIKAPVKANLFIKSKGDISVKHFNGDKLHLNSSEGSIFVDKFQGDSVNLVTQNGNIKLEDFIQATKIHVAVLENGSIESGRLQGSHLHLKTKNGNIISNASYSNESLFEVQNGNLQLQNAHKLCKMVVNDGNINLVGFDGKLLATVKKGSADIQLSKITDDSEVNILNGTLNLKVAESCQDYTQFKIQATECNIADSVKSKVNRAKEVLILTPDINEESTVSVNCPNGVVNIDSASWHDMIRLKLKK